MELSQLLFLALVFLVVVGAAVGLYLTLAPNASRARVSALNSESTFGTPGDNAGTAVMEFIADVAQPLGKLAAPDEEIHKSNLKLQFAHAGIRDAKAPTAFYSTKALLALVLPTIGFLVLTTMAPQTTLNKSLMWLLIMAGIGYYLPNLLLNNKIKERQREIFENFPDALDLMTVCVEAGLGTEAAMIKVGEEMQAKSKALGEELRLVNLELRAGANRERALRNLAVRTGVDEVDSFVTMINQAERFGTSIATSLRIQSDLLRTRRRQRAEEAAAKIGLKLLMPLVLCIFPALLVVLMGPAVINITKVLGSASGGG